MDFLRFLLARLNPSVAWQEDASVPLIVDLDQHHLAGIGTGDPVEKLSFLGPGKVTSSGFAWPGKGIEVCVDGGRIRELGFRFAHVAEPDQGTFAGSFQYGGEPVPLSGESSESSVQSQLGPPYWRDQDDEEIILFYESPEVEWQFEFDLDGTLKYLCIGLPLFADAGQRAAYGVTKPWPPSDPLSSRRRA